ncbi:MAG: hypothetical protein HYR56_09730 [Acidobacteria bacterium]|nr:hypothetical protein [Acidobacteriota bacterium]MBI3428280.1 hypothetical protein [Acidobacteriota bacterium]
MITQLHFSVSRRFKTTALGILIPGALERNGVRAGFEAKVDPGSEYCLFSRELADQLGIEVLDGLPVRLSTLAGGLTANAHWVTLHTLGLSFESFCCFTRLMEPTATSWATKAGSIICTWR